MDDEPVETISIGKASEGVDRTSLPHTSDDGQPLIPQKLFEVHPIDAQQRRNADEYHMKTRNQEMNFEKKIGEQMR